MNPIPRQLFAWSTILVLILAQNPRAAFAQTTAPKRPPTFSKEIVRIFQNRCQRCHHVGAPFAPMPLTNYKEVRPWAKSIQKKVVLKEMPPWYADSSPGEFTNDISISQQEIDTISQWVNARAPQGSRADLPPMKTFENTWQIGEPDIVIDTGIDFNVPATGTLPLRNFSVQTNFGEDRWLSAIEARPGNLAVVHQVVVSVQNPEEAQRLPDGGTLGDHQLGVYFRGETSSSYKEGEGKLIKSGATINFQILYVPNGTAATDRSRVALKFHTKPVRKHVVTRGISETRFEIPPHIAEFPIYATYTFDEPVTLISLRPHMHYRGQGFKYIAHLPDGTDNVILHVNRYNYNWQSTYYPGKPIELPVGTVLECIAVMNNSHDNPRNPEPHAAVRFGHQPKEEKMIGWIEYTRDNEDLTLTESQQD